MVANAKNFNEKGSDIHADAEKIRKLISNHMIKLNPAYANPNYTPFPTPLPEVGEPAADEEPELEVDEAQVQDADEEHVDGENNVQEDDANDVGGEEDGEGELDDPENDAHAAQERKLPKMILHGPRSTKEQSARRASSTPAIQRAEDAGESFDGNTFQQAQEKLITKIMEMTDEEYVPFCCLSVAQITDARLQRNSDGWPIHQSSAS